MLYLLFYITLADAFTYGYTDSEPTMWFVKQSTGNQVTDPGAVNRRGYLDAVVQANGQAPIDPAEYFKNPDFPVFQY